MIEICALCGKPAECQHHLIFGWGLRPLAESDNLKIPLCNDCHNMGLALQSIHGNPVAEKLSKMLGQAIWERNYIADRCKDGVIFEETARTEFRQRYGRSYL